jgi:hypothetical protein
MIGKKKENKKEKKQGKMFHAVSFLMILKNKFLQRYK